MSNDARIRQALTESGFVIARDVITTHEEVHIPNQNRRRFDVRAQLVPDFHGTPNNGMSLLRLALHDEIEGIDFDMPGWTREHRVQGFSFSYSANNGDARQQLVRSGVGRNDKASTLSQLNEHGMTLTLSEVLKSSDRVTITDISLGCRIFYTRAVRFSVCDF